MSIGLYNIDACTRIFRSRRASNGGFTLIEVLLAIIILTFGLLSTGRLIYSVLSSASLARSKQSAALIAQSKMDSLISMYERNAESPELQIGSHGPEEKTIVNPSDNVPLNRFEIRWIVGPVPDPRAGKSLKARIFLVTVTPIGWGSDRNIQASQNKAVSIASILAPKAP